MAKGARRDLAVRVILLPRDTREGGTIFGGVILSHLDLAGGLEAYRVGHRLSGGHARNFVTVAMREVVFKRPVYVGDVVSFYTRLVRVGTTSITVKVEVEAERRKNPRELVKVTEAEIVYVCIDDDGRPIPVRVR